MEGIEAAMVKAAVDLEPAVGEFASNVTGAPSSEIGAWLADHVRFRRWKTQIKIMRKAAEYAREAGFEPGEVPLKTLVPLLEGGSLEADSDDDMIGRWSALLANASMSQSRVLPSFPGILKELAPLEARILDALFDRFGGLPKEKWIQNGLQVSSLSAALKASPAQVEVAIENLHRLRLASPPATGLAFTTNPDHKYLVAEGSGLLCLTPLGFEFVRCCRPSDDRLESPESSG
jgi:hypothetical protein